ncbi:MAG: ATP-binding cassette domain-containing protein, partial [Hyphomicrobium sp.]|nr:ATP-binding cassette domain-containing protein [Hyphomicrobium sp.]
MCHAALSVIVLGVLLLLEEIFPVLALLFHDVGDDVEQVLVDALELVEDAGHLPDGVELDRGLEIDLPRGFRGVERRHRDRLAQQLERRIDLGDVRPPVGEVLGIAGLLGAGRSRLARMLFGLEPIASGTITLRGETISIGSARQATELGLALVPEDRRHERIVPRNPIAILTL